MFWGEYTGAVNSYRNASEQVRFAGRGFDLYFARTQAAANVVSQDHEAEAASQPIRPLLF